MNPHTRLDTDDTRFVLALGDGVVSVWPRLPKDVQKLIFEAAVKSDEDKLREPLALFLHDEHPRTTQGRPK
jgi:hypothetical protein